MKVVTISDFSFLFLLSSFFLDYIFPLKTFQTPQKNLFYYMLCRFSVSFHFIFSLLDRKETHQKDLTNILF